MSSYPERMQEGGVSGLGPGTTGVQPSLPPEGPGRPAPAADQPAPEEAPREEQRPRFDFFRRLLRPHLAAPEGDPSQEEGPPGATGDGRSAPGPAAGGANGRPGRQRQERPGAGAGAADSEQVTLSRAQLAEFVNGEVNRREAKKLAEADRARRRQLREADPIAYADEDREREAVEEAQAAQRERMGQSLAYYDQHTMLPFLNSLPPEIVEQLRQETGGGVEGLEGREALIARGRTLLEERIRADERAKLTGRGGRPLQGTQNGSGGPANAAVARALHKQRLLQEAEADVAPEPEVLGPGGGVAPPAQGADMNTQLRALLANGRGKR
jgi:hypothetical protein